jgi:hypothetical protein
MCEKVEAHATGRRVIAVPLELASIAIQLEPDILAPQKVVVSWEAERRNPQVNIYGAEPETPPTVVELREYEGGYPDDPIFVSVEVADIDGLLVRFELSLATLVDASGKDYVCDPGAGWVPQTLMMAELTALVQYKVRRCSKADIALLRSYTTPAAAFFNLCSLVGGGGVCLSGTGQGGPR